LSYRPRVTLAFPTARERFDRQSAQVRLASHKKSANPKIRAFYISNNAS
jgi:hypothetical protein